MFQFNVAVSSGEDDDDTVVGMAQCKAACLDLFIRRLNPSINFIKSQLSPGSQELLSLELAECSNNISTTFQSPFFTDSDTPQTFINSSPSSTIHQKRSMQSSEFVSETLTKRSHTSCVTMCSAGCEVPPGNCQRNCKGSNSCTLGCELRETLNSQRPGLCPQPSPEILVKNKGPQKECSSVCRSDSVCMLLKKCCTSGCSRTCMTPQFNGSVPNALTKLNLHFAPDGKVELDWKLPYENFLQAEGSLTFVLQARYCECKFYHPQVQSKWQTLTMTHQLGAKLDQFDPGRIYQFRLIAVSTQGSHGFSPPSDPFPERPPIPSPPSPPANLTDGIWRMYADGRTSVVISWDEPLKHHLKIAEYDITWSLDHGFVQSDGRSMESLTKYRQVIPASRRSYVIDNLMMGTSYKVQVQAVSYWSGYGVMKSQPNTLFLTTPKLNNANDDKFNGPINQGVMLSDKTTSNTNSPERNVKDSSSGSFLFPSGTDECECTTKSSSGKTNLLNTLGNPLRLSKPFYAHGQLTVVLTLPHKEMMIGHKIEWFPRVCIDSQSDRNRDSVRRKRGVVKLENLKSNEFNMAPLEFNCRYELVVSSFKTGPFKSEESSPYLRMCFCTPSCADVFVQSGHTPPLCVTQMDQTPPSPGPLFSELVNAQNFIYRLFWTHPPPLAATTSNTEYKYRIMWAPREEEPVDQEMYNDATGFQPILNLRHSNVRVVSQNVSEIYIQRLRPASLYIVKIQTLRLLSDHQTESQPVLHYFTTPGFKKQSVSDTSAEPLKQRPQLSNSGAPSVSYQLFYLLMILIPLQILWRTQHNIHR